MKKVVLFDMSEVEDLEHSLKTAHQYLNLGNVKEGHRCLLNALAIVLCETSNICFQDGKPPAPGPRSIAKI